MNIKIQTNDQLEMAFNVVVRHAAAEPRRQRRSRAAAWFQLMRRVVERAVDRTPVPEPRPVQTWLPNDPTSAARFQASHQRQLAE